MTYAAIQHATYARLTGAAKDRVIGNPKAAERVHRACLDVVGRYGSKWATRNKALYRNAVARKLGRAHDITLARKPVGDETHLGRRAAQPVNEQDADFALALETILVHVHDTPALVSIHDADGTGARKGPLFLQLQGSVNLRPGREVHHFGPDCAESALAGTRAGGLV